VHAKCRPGLKIPLPCLESNWWRRCLQTSFNYWRRGRTWH